MSTVYPLNPYISFASCSTEVGKATLTIVIIPWLYYMVKELYREQSLTSMVVNVTVISNNAHIAMYAIRSLATSFLC